MNALQTKYGDNLVVLGFPCNQFGLQEPGKNYTEITKGVEYVRPGNGFKPNFMLMQKLEVNGENENGFFTFLKKHCPPTRDGFSKKTDLYYHPFKNNDIRWNWEKFLINSNGKPYMRYDPSSDPVDVIDSDIEGLVSSERVNSPLTKQ
ncbi:glutathione peroxidase 6-like [Cimex lectularius]|uniref:Glutathione peroxidase n=1 Tax=Cimex lectularius TaxID=79782 RepID=A0A8I6RRX8_CIMLE|nr:glutathione peroxidase 6-like [Cimex lectularius]